VENVKGMNTACNFDVCQIVPRMKSIEKLWLKLENFFKFRKQKRFVKCSILKCGHYFGKIFVYTVSTVFIGKMCN